MATKSKKRKLRAARARQRAAKGLPNRIQASPVAERANVSKPRNIFRKAWNLIRGHRR